MITRVMIALVGATCPQEDIADNIGPGQQNVSRTYGERVEYPKLYSGEVLSIFWERRRPSLFQSHVPKPRLEQAAYRGRGLLPQAPWPPVRGQRGCTLFVRTMPFKN